MVTGRRALGAVLAAALGGAACTTLLGAEDHYELADDTGGPSAPDPVLKTACSRLGASACDGASVVAADAIDEQLHRAYCRGLQRCNLLRGGSDAIDDCLKGVTWAWLWPAQAAVAAGTVSYDGAAFGCCLADIDALSCDELSDQRVLRESPHCRQSFVPAKRGQACRDSLECVDGEYCDLTGCPGTCRPRASSDAPCTAADSCVTGATCQNGICRGHECPGAACDMALGSTQPTVCAIDTSCHRAELAASKTCAKAPAEGQYCDRTTLSCDGQSSCDLGAGQLTGACAALVQTKAPCELSLDCQAGTFCYGNKQQQTLCYPQYASGSGCTGGTTPLVAGSQYFAQQCAFPFHCLESDGAWTCRRFLSPAEATQVPACHGAGNDCPDGYVCKLSKDPKLGDPDPPSRCEPVGQAGAVCAHDRECASGFCLLDTLTCAADCR